MLSFSKLLAIATLLFAGVGCGSGRHSAVGFRLPADGDVSRGKIAFVTLACNSCHEVPGVDLPRPTVQPPVPVALGGEIDHQMTDGFLVASIIYPSFQITGFPKDRVTADGQSRMPHYADRMTVRQLTDVVAFLQSRYTVRPAPVYFYR